MASEESRSGVRARSHIRRVAVIVLVLCLAVALGAGAASAKKKKSKPSVFTASAAPNLVVPDAVNNVNETIVTSAITVPKKFKGRTVGDLNITGVQSTGDTANAAGRLNLMLVGPGGRSVLFDAGALGGQSIGPVTFDDDTQTSICDSVTCSDPDAS